MASRPWRCGELVAGGEPGGGAAAGVALPAVGGTGREGPALPLGGAACAGALERTGTTPGCGSASAARATGGTGRGAAGGIAAVPGSGTDAVGGAGETSTFDVSGLEPKNGGSGPRTISFSAVSFGAGLGAAAGIGAKAAGAAGCAGIGCAGAGSGAPLGVGGGTLSLLSLPRARNQSGSFDPPSD
jgi:hypothetical protein